MENTERLDDFRACFDDSPQPSCIIEMLPTLSKKPQKSHQKGMELPDPCRYFLCKLCGVLVAYFVLL